MNFYVSLKFVIFLFEQCSVDNKPYLRAIAILWVFLRLSGAKSIASYVNIQ